MIVQREAGKTIVILETSDEEYFLEQVTSSFEVDNCDSQHPEPPEMEEFINELNIKLDYKKFKESSK